MATNLNLSSPNEVVTIDQSAIDENELLINSTAAGTTVNITNTTGLTGVTTSITQTFNSSPQTVNLGENTHVLFERAISDGAPAGASILYQMGKNSTLELGSRRGIGFAWEQTIDFSGSEGKGTLLVHSAYSNGYLIPNGYPINANGFSVGDQIVVPSAAALDIRLENRGTPAERTQFLFNDADGDILVAFVMPGLYDERLFRFEGGTLSYACYLRGTNIATPDGEVKVEDLQVGDKLTTARGGVATVKWIGHRTLRRGQISAKDAIRAFPITFQKDSVSENVPHRDLTVSPGHLVLIDGSLIPAMALVNGKTITQDFSRKSFQYFHIELESFDILLADGLPAESYVDMGNRSMFENADTVDLHPEFEATTSGGRPQLDGITVQRSGSAVEAVRRRLLKRAESMTQSVRVSDPDLRVEINGQEIRAEVQGQIEGVMRFVLPAGTQASDVRILSRSAIVRDTTVHARRDLREVGVGLAGIAIEDASGRRDIDLMDSQLSGLHKPQVAHGVTMRWTNGATVIPAALLNLSGPAVLELNVLRTYSYWDVKQSLAA